VGNGHLKIRFVGYAMIKKTHNYLRHDLFNMINRLFETHT